MLKRLILAAAAVLLLMPAASQAAPVLIYHSPADDGTGGGTLALAAGNNTINLWFDPTGASGGGTYGISGIQITATGGVTVVAGGSNGLVCEGPGCLSGAVLNPPNGIDFDAGDTVNGDLAPTEIGTVVLNWDGATAGAFTITAGGGLDLFFGAADVGIGTVVAEATVAPEPTALVLLGLGLGGLAFARRRV